VDDGLTPLHQLQNRLHHHQDLKSIMIVTGMEYPTVKIQIQTKIIDSARVKRESE